MDLRGKSNAGWLASGTPWVWLTAGSVAFSLVLVLGVIGMISFRGMIHFWPASVVQLSLADTTPAENALGEVVGKELVTASRLREKGVSVPGEMESVNRLLLKIGNRKQYGFDFKWFNEIEFETIERPKGVAVIEREEWGNFYGFVVGLKVNGVSIDPGTIGLRAKLDEVMKRRDSLKRKIHHIEKYDMGELNHEMEELRLDKRRLELKGVPPDDARYSALKKAKDELDAAYVVLSENLSVVLGEINRDKLDVATIQGEVVSLDVKDLVRIYFPNDMTFIDKVVHYFEKIWEFISDDPREANTEGGIFPAIFGTVVMVLLMSVMVTPFGVVAAVYLNEYAKQGPLTRVIRIAVNNLAGVPSVVYGVFGLGFFVYFLGGTIDSLFYRANAPAPMFGTPGLMWSSLTLALLTVPVVIVSTEEGLTRIPRNIREGSLALGATKAETLWKTVLPMATPAMMTGLILAVARAAGEVAPLMMVGVVKLAPSLPLDGNFPFFHLDRKFMHLGFHIYDVGFQSPNVEAARPLVYATSFLLIIIIVSLNMTAIKIRNRLREKYNATET